MTPQRILRKTPSGEISTENPTPSTEKVRQEPNVQRERHTMKETQLQGLTEISNGREPQRSSQSPIFLQIPRDPR